MNRRLFCWSIGRVALLSVMIGLLLLPPIDAQEDDLATLIWALEQTYWDTVQAGDLAAHRALWNLDAFGWPYLVPEASAESHMIAGGYLTLSPNWVADSGQFVMDPLDRELTIMAPYLVQVTYTVNGSAQFNAGGEWHLSERVRHVWWHTAEGWQIITASRFPVSALAVASNS